MQGTSVPNLTEQETIKARDELRVVIGEFLGTEPINSIIAKYHIIDTPDEYWTIHLVLQDLADEFQELAEK